HRSRPRLQRGAQRRGRQAPADQSQPRIPGARQLARGRGASGVRRRRLVASESGNTACHRHARGPVKTSFLGLTALTLSQLGCASAVESSKMEDRARRTVPVPICIQPLERSTSGVSKVEPADYWKMVLPGFDAGSSTVDATSSDCAGRPAFSEQDLLSAEGPRAGSLPAKPEHAVVMPGPDGFRVVWLRTFEFADGSSSGPLALVRSREGYAEVYGTGSLRGKLKTTRLALERMGSRILVTATDEGCGEVKPGQGCETAFTVYVLGGGRLTRAASLPLDRIDYRPFPGLPG